MTFEDEFMMQYRKARYTVKMLEVNSAINEIDALIDILNKRYDSNLDSITSKAWLLAKVSVFSDIKSVIQLYGINNKVKSFFCTDRPSPLDAYDDIFVQRKPEDLMDKPQIEALIEAEPGDSINPQNQDNISSDDRENAEKPREDIIVEPKKPKPEDIELPRSTDDNPVVTLPKFAPKSLDEFIGQRHIVKRIKAEIAAAKKRGIKHLDHILLFGNRGLGKTTLMKLIAKELGVKFEFIDASQFSSSSTSKTEVMKFLKRISHENVPVVIAFDEIHALPTSIQTALLTLLNDRVYSYMENGATINMPIDNFTFIGATTDAQDVLATLKDRCNNLTFYLNDYSYDELQAIFINKFTARGLTINKEALEQCINRCRSSIREVDAFVSGLDTKAINNDTTEISYAMVLEYFKDIDRDPIGLKSKDLEILQAIYDESSGFISEDTLAARVHLATKEMTKEFEPYLIKIGFISISSRGRSLTPKAIAYLKGEEEPIIDQFPFESNGDGDGNV